MKFSKIIIVTFVAFIITFSCTKKKENAFHSAEESINFTLQKFPMISKNLQKVKEVSLDSLSISIYKNPEKKDYDEVLVFRKNKEYYAVPFFSNMYFDYWKFENEPQKQLYPKTNSNFEAQLKIMIQKLNLTPDEFDLIFNELMTSILNSETNLNLKPKIFENYIYLTERVDKYKTDDSDSCLTRNKKLFDKILLDSKKAVRYNGYFLDSKNGRVYERINDSRKIGEFKFRIRVYRIDCFSYKLSL